MKNTTKQVVILDNFASPYIHQAILILKNYNPEIEDKIVEEAERIVSEYLNNEIETKEVSNKKIIWTGALILGTIIFAGVLSYII